jgi:DNA-binding HxlR family transcriptional regulator
VRSYRQYCSLARALDVLGDRWTLLIVRELLLRGPSRYTDLRAGLPGIATNLLADRLRELEAAGVVAREEAPAPVATTLFGLTPRGEGLKDALRALASWGIGLMVDGPHADDELQAHWMTMLVDLSMHDREPHGRPVQIEARAGEESIVIDSSGGELSAHAGTAEHPDAVLAGPPLAVLGLLSGQLPLELAEAGGLSLTGARESVERLLPEPASAGDLVQ